VRSLEEREAIARQILTAPCEMGSSALSKQVGLSRQMVRQIRMGESYADVLPHLPRIDPVQMQRSCLDCKLFDSQPRRLRDAEGLDTRTHGRCSIGIPEAENIYYARGCGAFVEA
jgi:hypothetical protein